MSRVARGCAVALGSSVMQAAFAHKRDASLGLARSFRVGWGPRGLFALPHASSRLRVFRLPTPGLPAPAPAPSLDRLAPRPFVAPPPAISGRALDAYLAFLEPLLAHSRRTADPGARVPAFWLSQEGALACMRETLERLERLPESAAREKGSGPAREGETEEEQEEDEEEEQREAAALTTARSSWRLLQALHGRDTGAGAGADEALARKLALSGWLEREVLPVVRRELERGEANTQPHSHLRRIFLLLSARQVAEAVQEALRAGEPRMALLLAQFPVDSTRGDVSEQTKRWTADGVWERLPEERRNLWRLLAGDATHPALLNGLDWRRALALHAWFGLPFRTPVPALIAAFEEARRQARPPLPACYEERNFDTPYYILRAYADRAFPLHRVLEPSLSTAASPLDCRLAFHLLPVLLRLGYATPRRLRHLQIAYSAQLEAAGLWHWAAFVLLFRPEQAEEEEEGEEEEEEAAAVRMVTEGGAPPYAEDEDWRAGAVKRLVAQHMAWRGPDEPPSAEERFLRERLGVPGEWIAEALSWAARARDEPAAELAYLLASAQWQAAHDLICARLAPDLLLRSETDADALGTLVRQLQALEGKHVRDWDAAGAVYLDYLRLRQAADALRALPPDAAQALSARANELLQSITDLCLRLGNAGRLPNLALRQRVCYAEISAWVATAAVQHLPPAQINRLLPHFASLQLPENYRIRLLHRVAPLLSVM